MSQTIYIHPGATHCNVYAIPYPMKPSQSPCDIPLEKQGDWKHIGRLDRNLQIVYLDESYHHISEDIQGQMGGTYFDVPSP